MFIITACLIMMVSVAVAKPLLAVAHPLLDTTPREMGACVLALGPYVLDTLIVCISYLQVKFWTTPPVVNADTMDLDSTAAATSDVICHHADLHAHSIRSDAVCSMAHLLSIDYKVAGISYKLVRDGRLHRPAEVQECVNMLSYSQSELRSPSDSPILAVAFSATDDAHTNVTRLFDQLQGACGDFEETRDITLNQVLTVAGIESSSDGHWMFFCVGDAYRVPVSDGNDTTLGIMYNSITKLGNTPEEESRKKSE